MRIVVTGREGQVARALVERAAGAGAMLVAVGRPELDLERPETIGPALAAARPDVIVNAAAYTAVDLAESAEATALAVNGAGAGEVAAAASRLGVPVIQISTDYVFDGGLGRPYREDDATGPISAYGRSKLAGEQAVAAATPDHAILRTAWVYSPFGRNFVRTMLRLGTERSEVGVVADQIGSPTSALDIADAVLAVARNLVERPDDAALRGIFHMAAQGEASWAEVAEAAFADAKAAGRKPVQVKRIATSDYPTPARRPANSRLDGARLASIHGVSLPHWRGSLTTCVARLLTDERAGQGS
ncbi:dTDP-4-dehydrorhamnose reductase [Bosea vaviloviae]|uniref:dTDP-4-dehydrorhamnose reductase n=1 Tax=Bosea vaviloviae TaxID=1526658 RepID=A0A0N1N4E2_9HYPH|nr:dTDP-4-dehydrorhamnose reductase [Bosea vaviloviae]KPH81496.1 dTDP-4-dehydrorhamnose reductase [Bosea vaviloviae]